MKQYRFLAFFIPVLFLLVFLTPTISIAATPEDSGIEYVTPEGSGDETGRTVALQNPLAAQSITEFFMGLLSVLLVFAVPLIVFFIILAGFKYVMAQGKPEEISKANKALLYAVIGGLLILGATIILQVIESTIAAFTLK